MTAQAIKLQPRSRLIPEYLHTWQAERGFYLRRREGAMDDTKLPQPLTDDERKRRAEDDRKAEAEEAEYRARVERFAAKFDAGARDTDKEFLHDAVYLFCIETMRMGTPVTAQQKAAFTLVKRLMAFPENRKSWAIDLPYVFMAKEDALTPSEIKRRSIAFEVVQQVWEGAKVTHAIADVAAKHKKSPQKIAKDYYEWEPQLQWLRQSRPD